MSKKKDELSIVTTNGMKVVLGDSEVTWRNLIIPEPMVRALLVSHLMGGINLIKEYQNELEDVKYDKERKMITFVFSKDNKIIVDKIAGVVLIKDEAGVEIRMTKYVCNQMLKAGRKIELIAEADTIKELDEKVKEMRKNE